MYKKLKEELKDGSIGEVKMLHVLIGADRFERDERIRVRELGGGVLLTMGCYAIQLASFVFGEEPQKIIADGVVHPINGI